MVRRAGANMETVRRRNRAAILKYINDNGPASRKDLADVIGLTPAAVTQICAELLAEGILFENGQNVARRGAGRKKKLLDINYDACGVCAVNIEPEYTTVAVSNLKGERADVERIKTDASVSPREYLARIARRCAALMKRRPEGAADVRAVGVGITGIVDRERGRSVRAYGIWDEPVEVAEILGELLKLPVCVENNVNAFAVAELLYGAGKEHDNLMVIKWGPGVGCAMIIDQQVYEGRHSKAAELGHFIVEKDGERCKCGRRGCLETKVSYSALCKITPFQTEEFGEVYARSAGSETGRRFDEAIDLFARSIINSATIMAPNRIVITGSLFENPGIRRAVARACAGYDESWGENGAKRMIYSSLSEMEHYIGPVAVCVKKMLFS